MVKNLLPADYLINKLGVTTKTNFSNYFTGNLYLSSIKKIDIPFNLPWIAEKTNLLLKEMVLFSD